MFEHVVVEHDARCHQLGDPALDQRLGEFGVFQLFADGDPAAVPDQFGQIGVDGMVGKSGHFDAAFQLGPFGEHDAQNLCRPHGILTVGLVKVAHAEQQHRVGMLCLDLRVLAHQRGFGFFHVGR